MTRHLALGLKLSAFILLSLALAMALLRMLWPDISWGFLLLFGLQVVLLLATLQLLLTTIWQPSKRWDLPQTQAELPRRIFAPKASVVRFLSGLGRPFVQTLKAKALLLFKRKTA
jgi:hypothetical protein